MDRGIGEWGASGLAALTGAPTGAPDFGRAGVLAAANAVAAEFGSMTGVEASATELLAGRAALLGLTRRGQVSAGGATRLLPARGGWFALTLSRADDVDLVPALVEADAVPHPWDALRDWACDREPAEVVDRARLLDLPAAVLGEATPAAPSARVGGVRTGPRSPAGLLVVDMSSMWAGPSCAQLLRRAGATVVKVESHARPDGTRSGPRPFFDWVNGGKLSHAVDFDDVTRLRSLLEVADVVIESSRPAGLRRRGVGPHEVTARDGRVWLTIVGHRDHPGAAFGDDAAVAGGLVGRGGDGPVFCADAIADPLTGLHGAVAVAEALQRGGGESLRVAMADVAATYAALPLAEGTGPVADPVAPPPGPPASELGADRVRVERLIDERRCARC